MWLWIGKLHCWLYEPPVPVVSGCRAGPNLIDFIDFLCVCPNDCCFLPDWLPRFYLYSNWLELEFLELPCCAVVVL